MYWSPVKLFYHWLLLNTWFWSPSDQNPFFVLNYLLKVAAAYLSQKVAVSHNLSDQKTIPTPFLEEFRNKTFLFVKIDYRNFVRIHKIKNPLDSENFSFLSWQKKSFVPNAIFFSNFVCDMWLFWVTSKPCHKWDSMYLLMWNWTASLWTIR